MAGLEREGTLRRRSQRHGLGRLTSCSTGQVRNGRHVTAGTGCYQNRSGRRLVAGQLTYNDNVISIRQQKLSDSTRRQSSDAGSTGCCMLPRGFRQTLLSSLRVGSRLVLACLPALAGALHGAGHRVHLSAEVHCRACQNHCDNEPGQPDAAPTHNPDRCPLCTHALAAGQAIWSLPVQLAEYGPGVPQRWSDYPAERHISYRWLVPAPRPPPTSC
jgi:hypothetical protein